MNQHDAIDETPGELTPYLELDRVLVAYAHDLRAVLRNNFVGLYLSGSLAVGDFDLTSDVDLIVVNQRELVDNEVQASSRLTQHVSANTLAG